MRIRKTISLVTFFIISTLIMLTILFCFKKYNKIVMVENNTINLNSILLDNSSTYQIKGNWKEVENVNYLTNNVNGYKLYQLKIISSQRQEIALKFNNYQLINNIFINDTIASQSPIFVGKFTDNDKEILYISKWDYKKRGSQYIVDITLEAKEWDNQDSNKVFVGVPKAVHKDYMISGYYNIFTIGIFFMCILICLTLFINKRSEKYLIYMTLFVFLILLKSVVNSNIIPLIKIVNYNYNSYTNIKFIVSIICIIMVFYIYNYLYFNMINKKITKPIIIGIIILGLLLSFLNIDYWIKEQFVILVYFSIFILCIIIAVKAYFEERNNVLLILVGHIFYFITVIIKILVLKGNSGYGLFCKYVNVDYYGSLVFIIMLMIAVAMRYGSKFNEAEILSVEINNLKKNLSKMIEYNTKGLKTTNEKLYNAYQQLSEAQETRQTTFFNVSNDLKTPISIIQGYVDAMRDGWIEEGEAKEKFIEKIHDKVDYLSQLINDLYLLFQLEEEKLIIKKSFVEINVFIRLALKDLMKKTMKKNINIDINLAQNRIMIDIDKSSFYMAVEKIIVFLVDYLDEGSVITIGTYIQGNVNIFIQEKSQGYNQEKLNLLLYQYKTDPNYITKKSKNDFGLGLFIANEIIKQHGGTLSVESKEGVGTTFYIKFK